MSPGEKTGIDAVSGSDLEILENFYARVRSQIEHENELYNQRIIWLITIQALLYATVGLLIQAVFSVQDKRLDTSKIYIFIGLISFLGVFVALISGRILRNGRDALSELRLLWNENASSLPAFASYAHLFPNASGGLASRGRSHMIFSSGNLPYVFAVSWVISFGILVGEFVFPYFHTLLAWIMR